MKDPSGRRRATFRHVLVLLAVAAAACSGTAGPVVSLDDVEPGTVVQTVVAPATIEPRDRVTVEAPASGTVAELLVADGDTVAIGDPLLRLTAPSIDQGIAQAEAAVAAADALANVQAGVDLSPLVGAVSDQLAAVVPGLLDALAAQAQAIEDDEARTAAEAAVARAVEGYENARAGLEAAEAEAAAAASASTASQRAAAQAQRRQAELALEIARSRAEDLLVVAPAAGVVELTRGGGTSTGAGVGSLEDLAGLPDLSGLAGGGVSSSSAGPVAVGVEVTAGQSLVTLFDVGAFRAVSRIDEIDVVEVFEDQRVVVLVDAFPEVELAGVVDHVGIEPETSATGGVAFPVDVRLVGVPAGLGLRVGLSGSVEIEVRTVESETVVPSSALRRRGEQDVVVAVRDGVAVEVPVTVLAIGEDTAAVSGELQGGELVVVEGIDEVTPGQPLPAGATPADDDG